MRARVVPCRPPLARFPSGDLRLAEEAVSAEDLQYAVEQVGAAAVPSWVLPGGR